MWMLVWFSLYVDEVVGGSNHALYGWYLMVIIARLQIRLLQRLYLD